MKLLSVLFILSVFTGSAITILAEEKLEHKPEDIEESNIIMNKDFDRLIVDINGDNSNYKSIQKAINDASIGTTIYVKEGVYCEIINIYKKISLIGENKERTFIKTESKKNGYVIQISAENVYLSGFSISNGGPGLYTTGLKIIAPRTTIDDCDIFDTPVGIAMWSSNNTISNCTFWGCDDEGIAFLGSPTIDCNDNKVINCVFFKNCDGIELQHSSNNIISFCEFYDNTHAGIDAIGSSNNNNIISNCDLYDNKAFGIYLSRSNNNQIKSCSINQNQIMMYNEKDTLVIDSDIESMYLVKSKINVMNCKNFAKSKVKAIDSEYSLINTEPEEISTREQNTNMKNSYFLTFLNLIKQRLEIIKSNILLRYEKNYL